MLRFSVFVLPLRRQAAILSVFVAVLVFASGASAALLDLDVSNGDYNVAASWINHTTSTSAVPTTLDDAIVRNGGTLNITAADGNASAAVIRIGAGPQSGDPVAPPTYAGTGTLNWTGGNILGAAVTGARLNVGERDNTNNINFTGIVNQSGGKISLNTTGGGGSFLNIGANGTTPTPTSTYNLMPGGTIGLITGAGNNNGINVRNGTLNMTGGQIIHDDGSIGQRAMTISSASGTLGSENVATANFSGGIVNVRGGMRMASSGQTKAFATISGTADLKFVGGDFQLGANATNAYAQLDMSGGSLRVGDPGIVDERRLIVGDSGTGVFNLSGGTVNVNHSMVVNNNPATAKGTFYQTGGTFTVRDIETNRNTPVAADLTVENAAIIIDGPTAVFNQQNTGALTGEMSLGHRGNGRFEIRQGQANIRLIEISNNPESRATLNVFGGKLTLIDGILRNNVSALNTPVLNLTGGELELQPPGSAISWNSDLPLNGTDFDPKPGAVMGTNVGSFPNKFANFSMNTGTIWDLDIASNTLVTGADYVDVPNPTLPAVINGGLLNIHHIGGYTPAVGDTVMIVRNASLGVTLNNIQVSDPNWQAVLGASGTELRLTYVPEPTSMMLFGIGLAMFSATRRTSRK